MKRIILITVYLLLISFYANAQTPTREELEKGIEGLKKGIGGLQGQQIPNEKAKREALNGEIANERKINQALMATPWDKKTPPPSDNKASNIDQLVPQIGTYKDDTRGGKVKEINDGEMFDVNTATQQVKKQALFNNIIKQIPTQAERIETLKKEIDTIVGNLNSLLKEAEKIKQSPNVDNETKIKVNEFKKEVEKNKQNISEISTNITTTKDAIEQDNKCKDCEAKLQEHKKDLEKAREKNQDLQRQLQDLQRQLNK
jgi:DNA repair exonuclease SbcCD ATPase subunit